MNCVEKNIVDKVGGSGLRKLIESPRNFLSKFIIE